VSLATKVVVVFGMAVLISVVARAGSGPNVVHSISAEQRPMAIAPLASTRAARSEPQTLRTRAGYFGSKRRQTLERAIALAASGDDDGLNRMLRTRVVFPVPVDDVVVLESGSLVKLRGTSGEFWTVIEAVGE
jgi:hypothetical protein